MRLLEGLLRRRRLVRAPLTLYHLGGARLLGRRLVLLKHRGRTSGRWREVVLEVVDRPDPRTLRVVSGLGRRPPAVVPQHRGRRAGPGHLRGTARPRPRAVLGHQEARGAFGRYAGTHPRSWAALEPVVRAQVSPGQDLAEAVPVVDLVLEGSQPAPEAPNARPSR